MVAICGQSESLHRYPVIVYLSYRKIGTRWQARTVLGSFDVPSGIRGNKTNFFL